MNVVWDHHHIWNHQCDVRESHDIIRTLMWSISVKSSDILLNKGIGVNRFRNKLKGLDTSLRVTQLSWHWIPILLYTRPSIMQNNAAPFIRCTKRRTWLHINNSSFAEMIQNHPSKQSKVPKFSALTYSSLHQSCSYSGDSGPVTTPCIPYLSWVNTSATFCFTPNLSTTSVFTTLTTTHQLP